MKLIAMILILAGAVHAQTIGPITAEYGKHADGTFQVQNNSLQPLSVVIEPWSFSLDKDGQHMRQLDSTVHVTLSETSARLSPKEVHEFSYKVKCDILPCTLSFMAEMVVGHTQDGLAVRILLPHAVYICAKQNSCRRSILDAAGLQAHQ